MRALRRHAVVMRRHGLSTDLLVTGVLVVLSAFAALGMVIGTEWVPPSLFILIELLGGFVLRFRAMVVLCVAIVLEIAVMGSRGWAISGRGRSWCTASQPCRCSCSCATGTGAGCRALRRT